MREPSSQPEKDIKALYQTPIQSPQSLDDTIMAAAAAQAKENTQQAAVKPAAKVAWLRWGGSLAAGVAALAIAWPLLTPQSEPTRFDVAELQPSAAPAEAPIVVAENTVERYSAEMDMEEQAFERPADEMAVADSAAAEEVAYESTLAAADIPVSDSVTMKAIPQAAMRSAKTLSEAQSMPEEVFAKRAELAAPSPEVFSDSAKSHAALLPRSESFWLLKIDQAPDEKAKQKIASDWFEQISQWYHSDQQRLAISHQKALQAAWPDYYAEHAKAWDEMVKE